jgi:Zn-finger protein
MKSKTPKVIVPLEQSQPVRCGYCPSLIFKDREVNGRLHLIDGSPACVRCRILKSKTGKQIVKDKAKLEEDLAEKERVAQLEADQEVRVIAHESQIATKTAISKK